MGSNRSTVWRGAALAVSLALSGLALLGGSTALANGVALNHGDVLAAIGNGQVKHFDSSGNLLDTLDTSTGAAYTAGMCFDSSGNMYVTDFGSNALSEFGSGGNLLASTFGSGFNSDPESCSVDAANNIYVGEADGSGTVLKLDTSGNLLATYNPARESRGTDWVDLASDQKTLYYTSEGSSVKRFDVSTNTQLPDFATGLPAPCFALRIRSNGEVLVACSSVVERLDSSGNVIQTYTGLGSGSLFALNLDPDGTSFWTGDLFSGQIYRVDIATGNVLTTFNANQNTALGGLAVVGELRAAQSSITLAPLSATNPVGTQHTLTATVTKGGSPESGKTVTFTVTGPNAQTGTGVTNANGQATFTYTGNNAGTDTILASFIDDSGATQTSNSVTKTWVGGDQLITASGQSVSATEGVQFSGQVASFTDPDPSASAGEYTGTIDWGDGTATTTGTITGGGGGSFFVNGDHTYADEGSHSITVTITDVDNTSNAAVASSPVTIRDAALTAAAVGSAPVSPQSFSGTVATFTDANTSSTTADFAVKIDWGDGGATSAGTVSGSGGSYTVSGAHTYTSTGYFTIKVHIVDDGGSTADATTRALIFATTKGGSFVISYKKVAPGTAVNFWGSQWAKNNPLLTTPPSAFKGFEDQPTVTACGQSWKTDPGNSTPPPNGPLPAYIAVLASSRITAAPSSTVTGDTVNEVVVQTNPGYGPAPSTAGTGTVVATIC